MPSRHDARLSTNRFPSEQRASRTRPRRDAWMKAGEVSSQLPFSCNPLWGMLQLHLCPEAEVCQRRSRRWADKITKAKAVRE